MKYFVLGAFSSAIFLYGIALVYGATGTTSLSGIATFLANVTLVDERHAARRADAAAGRARVQDRRGPVPHVDPRRVRGLADPDHRVHVLGHEGGRVRRVAPGPAHRVRGRTGPTGARRSGPSRSSPCSSAASSPWSRPTSSGCSPTRRSATPATCSSGSRPGRAQGLRAALFYLFVYTFMTIGTFAIVAVHRPARRPPRDPRLPGLGDPATAARRAVRVLPARPGRHPADRRLHRQAGGVRLGGEQPRVRRPAGPVVLAPGRRRDRLGDRRVLLPPGHRDDVLVRGRHAPKARTTARVEARPISIDIPTGVVLVVCAARHALGRDPAVADPRLRPRRHPSSDRRAPCARFEGSSRDPNAL